MEMVIDTSAILAVVLNEPEKPALIKATSGVDLVAPASLPFEIGNAFSAMFKRRRLGVADARQALAIYEQIPVRFVDVNLDAALEVAERHNMYAYDAYMMVCAQKLAVPLLTLDSGLVHAATNAGLQVVKVKT